MNKYKIKPKALFELMETLDFPDFKRGDLIFTNNRKSLFARLIRWADFIHGETSVCNHTEMYLGHGKAFSADSRMAVHDIRRYFKGKHDVYFYRNVTLSNYEKDRLVAEAMRWKGKPYDVLGIFWKALDVITGKNFSEKHNGPMLAYCSELVQRIYFNATERIISEKKIGTATPNDIRNCLEKSDNVWKCVFFVIKIGGKWIEKVKVKEEC